MSCRSLRRRYGWIAPLLLALLIAAAILTRLDKWLYSNEVFNNLSMGLSYSSQNETLVQLKREALHYCAEYAPASELKACNIYQDSITDRLYFAHPLTALVGLQVRGLLGHPDALAKLHWIALEPPLIGAAIALPMLLLLILAMPCSDRTPASLFMFLIIFIGQCYDRELLPIADLIHDAGGWPAPLTIIAVAATFYWAATRATARRPLPDWTERLSTATKSRALCWLAVALFAISAIAPPALDVIVAPLALVASIAASIPLARRASNLSPLLLAATVGLLFAAVTAEPYWIARRLGMAASFATLLYMAVIGLVSVNPRTRLVWVLPLIAVFHAPLTALVGLATMISEVVLKMRGNKPSGLLYASTLSFAVGIGLVLLGINSTAFAPGSAALSDVIALVFNWSGLLPACVSMAIVALFALVPLRNFDDASIAFSRAGLLIAQGVGAALISVAILRQDPDLLNAPGYAMFAKPADYITPALFGAGILALLLLMRHWFVEHDPAEIGDSRQSALLLVCAVLLLISASKLDLRIRNSYGPAPINLWRYVIAGELHPQWCRHLRQANFNDETYYLSKEDPTNDAIIYWSALKARLRIDRGVSKPQDFVVLPAPDNEAGCD